MLIETMRADLRMRQSTQQTSQSESKPSKAGAMGSKRTTEMRADTHQTGRRRDPTALIAMAFCSSHAKRQILRF
jgi:hypothetical protein